MKKYFLHDGTTQYGPFDLSELESKIITPQTMIWYDPLPNWKPAGEIEELKSLLNSKVPASQVLTPPVMSAKEDDWNSKMYYYADDHGQQGPFTFEQLKSRTILASTPIWYDPLPEWTTADKIPGLIQLMSHVPAAAAITPVVPKKLYYYLDAAGQKQGPFELEQLKGAMLNATTLVWYEPLTEWTAAGKIAELKEVLTQTSVVTPSSPQSRLYYYIDNTGKQQGPFDLAQMKTKGIHANTLIWYDSLPEWKKAGSDDSLKEALAGGSSGQVDWSRKLFYYTDATGQQGPFTLDQMRTKYITAATPVWYDPLPNWTTAGQVEALRSIIR